MRQSADVVVIGAGAVGAACAYFLARAGLSVQVVERGSIAGGTMLTPPSIPGGT